VINEEDKVKESENESEQQKKGQKIIDEEEFVERSLGEEIKFVECLRILSIVWKEAVNMIVSKRGDRYVAKFNNKLYGEVECRRYDEAREKGEIDQQFQVWLLGQFARKSTKMSYWSDDDYNRIHWTVEEFYMIVNDVVNKYERKYGSGNGFKMKEDDILIQNELKFDLNIVLNLSSLILLNEAFKKEVEQEKTIGITKPVFIPAETNNLRNDEGENVMLCNSVSNNFEPVVKDPEKDIKEMLSLVSTLRRVTEKKKVSEEEILMLEKWFQETSGQSKCGLGKEMEELMKEGFSNLEKGPVKDPEKHCKFKEIVQRFMNQINSKKEKNKYGRIEGDNLYVCPNEDYLLKGKVTKQNIRKEDLKKKYFQV
jgi:hypothetical protein